MKKQWIPLAVMALMSGTTAMAQSSVTVFGVMDAGVLALSNVSGGAGYIPSTVNKGSVTKLQGGGVGQSYFGFSGKEDLGGGMRATFMLQANVDVPTGNAGGPNSTSSTSFFNQFSTVGLGGGFGEITMGRLVSPMYFAMLSTDAREARYFGSALTALVGLNSASGVFIGNNSNPSFGTVYNDNAVVYTTPTWNGLTANLEYAFGGTAGSMKSNSQEAATLLYKNNGLKLSALYYTGYGNNVPAATTLYTAATGSATTAATLVTKAGLTPTANTNQLASLGALYAWDQFSVSTSYFVAKNPANAVVNGGSGSLNLWSLAGSWKVSPLVKLTTGYYRMNDKTNSGNYASQFALGADYALSKRTFLYAEMATVTNHGKNMNLSPIYGNAVVANANNHAEMIGLRHSF